MSDGYVRVDKLKKRYRAIYLAPIILGLVGGIFVGIIATTFLMDVLGLASETKADMAIVGLVYLSTWAFFFMVGSSITVGAMILIRLISPRVGILMLTGRGVPTDWYR